MLHFTDEHFPEYEPRTSSEKRLLVGIDAPLSAETRYALERISEFVVPYSKQVQFHFLNVIPVPSIGGRYAPRETFPPTSEQRKQAAEALRIARVIMQEHGIPGSHIEAFIRVGTPAEELVNVAKEHHVDCLVVGRRRPPPVLGLRRLLMGNTSHDVQHKAPCPVMVVTLPRSARAGNLVSWYEASLRQALQDHANALLNLTASDVTVWFPPPARTISERRERRAAAKALERLACSGALYRQDVQGETHYLSD